MNECNLWTEHIKYFHWSILDELKCERVEYIQIISINRRHFSRYITGSFTLVKIITANLLLLVSRF